LKCYRENVFSEKYKNHPIFSITLKELAKKYRFKKDKIWEGIKANIDMVLVKVSLKKSRKNNRKIK
jgi:hypothetical protein